MANQAPREQSSDQNVTQQPFNSAGGRMGGGMTSNGTKYAPQLIAYAIVFLGLSIAAYYLLTGKKLKVHPGNEKMLILTLLCVGLFLRVFSATLMDGHPFDLNLFRNWATAAANNLFGVYTNSRSIDYPPLYMYVLYLIGKIASITAMSPYFTLLLKLPSMVADIATSLIIYKLARKYLSAEISVLLSAFYIFNPAVLINSTFWGQVDSFFTLIVTAAIFLLSEKKTGPSAALFTAAVLMKPQGIIFLPVLFFELVRQKKLKRFVSAAVYALSTAVLIVLPFSLHQGALWIFKLYASTV
jgi:4-amino-4-deoxy-L-arabinose transferase-like glycosyltransferase